jgi:hypothetical protein
VAASCIARPVSPVQSTVNTVTRTWAPPVGVAYTGTYNPFDDCDLFNPAANSKRPGAVSCGAISNPLFGQVATRTTNYDPELVEGWHVRPNNWEMQFSVQHELVPRVSVYAGYSRRWYGNLQATRNLNVTNADYTTYCPVPADSRRNRRHAAVRLLRHQSRDRAQQPDLQFEQSGRDQGRLRRVGLRCERAVGAADDSVGRSPASGASG